MRVGDREQRTSGEGPGLPAEIGTSCFYPRNKLGTLGVSGTRIGSCLVLLPRPLWGSSLGSQRWEAGQPGFEEAEG